MDEISNVYGKTYLSAKNEMEFNEETIKSRVNNPFSTEKECCEWANEHHLDILVITRFTGKIMHSNHKGVLLDKAAYCNYFSNVLLINDKPAKKKKGKEEESEVRRWIPAGFEYASKMRVASEQSDGLHKALWHRDYFTPTGYYDREKETFNIAKPQEWFARQTGRDTSHIYKYISAIAGDCALHLLAWLRYKMCNPTSKTEVVPIIVSKTQGNGKTTFAEVICKGLFGKDNVIVTDQYDSKNKFNSDNADALIICHEESEYEDKRNTVSSLKARSTATTIRKEHKGRDPFIQESVTDFIMTSNEDVPIKFADSSDQRRFMVMEADSTFTRDKSPIADEVFRKLYGIDINGLRTEKPFADDKELIEQFKYELYNDERIKNTNYKKFPHTEAYNRCFTLPRSNEAVEIESIVRSIAPFIKQSLLNKSVVTDLFMQEEHISLSHYIDSCNAIQYIPSVQGKPGYIAVCRPLVFYDRRNAKQFSHATIEKVLLDCARWLLSDYDIVLSGNHTPLATGFRNVESSNKYGAAARFYLASEYEEPRIVVTAPTITPITAIERLGKRLRVNNKWQPDPIGPFETVNEMKEGITSLKDKSSNVQYMDTFLLEADTAPSSYIQQLEKQRLESSENRAEVIFRDRLALQQAEATRLFDNGTVARVVYSGGKSYHMLIRVADSPNTLEEYKWLHSYLCEKVSTKLVFDPLTADPARLTRAPTTYERSFEYKGKILTGTQLLIKEDWTHVYSINWRHLYKQWLERPLDKYELNGRRMVPCKVEYKEAMMALLKGTFWNEPLYNGKRQELFFPAYRLCRYIGYTHEQLWSKEGILDGIDSYYKPNEINYWKSREKCDLIRLIDKEYE